MESNALNIIKLVLLSIIAVALVFIIVLLMNNKFNFSIGTGSKAKLIYDESYTEEVNKIKVNATSSDVKVIENDKDEINVKIYDEKNQEPSVNVNDGVLEIINKKEKVSFGFINIMGNNQPRIIISIPKDKKYDLDFETNSGDITVEKDMNNVNINVKSGDIELKNAKTTTIKTTSGDVELGNVENLSLNTTSGDVKIDKVSKKVKIDVTSGDITIRELELTTNSSIKAISGDVNIDKTNDIYVDAHATSGDIDLGDNNRKSNIELKINTTSGDIEVN